ncbi:MAG: hypothetical protein V4543_11300 [Bacteroidota bacterium]
MNPTQSTALKTGLSPERRELILRVCNGLAAYAAAWLLVFAFCQLAAGLVSENVFNIPAKLYSCYIVYSPRFRSWTSNAIIVTFMAGPVTSLFIAFFAHLAGRLISARRSVAKEFLMWLRIHALTFFFGALVSGAITSYGTGYAIKAMLGSSIVARMIVGFLGLICLIVVSIWLAKKYMNVIFSRRALSENASVNQMLASAAGSWLAGCFIIWLTVFLPVKLRMIPLQNVVMFGISFLPTLIFILLFKRIRNRSITKNYSNARGESRKPLAPVRPAPVMYGTLVMLAITWYFVFKNGLDI